MLLMNIRKEAWQGNMKGNKVFGNRKGNKQEKEKKRTKGRTTRGMGLGNAKDKTR